MRQSRKLGPGILHTFSATACARSLQIHKSTVSPAQAHVKSSVGQVMRICLLSGMRAWLTEVAAGSYRQLVLADSLKLSACGAVTEPGIAP
jgi:hypothetical protein